MIITIVQTTTKVLTQDRKLLSSRVDEAFMLEPSEGNIIKHKETGITFNSGISVSKEYKIKEYIEIPKEEA